MTSLHDELFGSPKKQINSKNKGDNNQRDLSKVLSKWVKQPFASTPRSGGLRYFNRSDVVGDVICTNEDHYYPFTNETKHLRKIHLTPVLRIDSAIYNYWRQAAEDGTRASKIPLLFLRANYDPANTWTVWISTGHLKASGMKELEQIRKYTGEVGSCKLYGFSSVDLFEKYTYTQFKKLFQSCYLKKHKLLKRDGIT